MVYALITSKKAQNVVKTSVDLSRQDEGDEMFGSSAVARSIVRSTMSASESIAKILPDNLKRWADSRFNKDVMIMENGAAFDLIRASVNLVLAGLLIALGTSLKLPLYIEVSRGVCYYGTKQFDHGHIRSQNYACMILRTYMSMS